MPVSVDHCWTTPSLCSNGGGNPLQKHSYSSISDCWHMFILKYVGQLHLSHLSISQHYIQGIHKVSNSLVNMKSICVFRDIVPTFAHQYTSFVTVTCSEEHFLWQYCTICACYSKDGSVWQAYSIYNVYFIQHSLSLHHPPPFVMSRCPSYYYPVAFQGRHAQVFQIYGNRKLTDPHFHEKIWPISVHPSEYI